MPTDLAAQTSFSATWTASSVEDDLRRWSAFLTGQGLTWSLEDKDRAFVDQMVGSAAARSGEMIELRLAALASSAIARARDPRRLVKLASSGAPSTWYLLTREQQSALEAAGHRFESGLANPLRNLATIPVTLGVYFGAQYVCRRAGLDPNVAWLVAVVAYVLTVRVVRGRWPFQRA